jgi:hypothetical protein
MSVYNIGLFLWAAIAQMAEWLATGWTVQRLNPGGGLDFLHSSRLDLGPTQPSVQLVSGLSQGCKYPWAMPWLMWTAASLSQQKPKFNPTLLYFGFIAERLTQWQVFLPALQFSLVSIIPPLLHSHSFSYHRCSVMFFYQHFSFPLSVSFHHSSILTHSSTTDAV